MGKVYGYIRISPKEHLSKDENGLFLDSQNFYNFNSNFSNEQKFLLKKQCDQLRSKYDIDLKNIYAEVHPGDNFDRPVWKRLKEQLQEKDRVVVMTLKVFSTSTFRTTLKEIDSLRQRGITLYIVDLEMAPKENKNILDYVSEIYDYFERIQLERQSTGIAAITVNPILRKEKYPGRKSILDPQFFKQLQELLNQGTTSPSVLAKELKTSRSTIYKALKLIREEETFS
jgi:DNA invertase Pin-like site-specific DNA recombinase